MFKHSGLQVSLHVAGKADKGEQELLAMYLNPKQRAKMDLYQKH